MVKRYGRLYEELKLKRGSVIFLQPAFFLLRRLILAIAVVLLSDYLIVQIYLMVAQILIAVFILEYVKPLKEPY